MCASQNIKYNHDALIDQPPIITGQYLVIRDRLMVLKKADQTLQS